MKIVREKIKENIDRDIYWTRIYFESEDKNRKSKVLACASWEYILDSNRIKEIKDIHIDNWREIVIKKWESLGDDIFNEEVHYDVYANTPEGKINGLEFLKEIDVSKK
jgi:hypothetical protein